ncbi:hypothetical protein VD0002_g1673 [Verticillium dahliae]|nr:hypothetical protein VD0002_g1673 [Verticillium dahliae]
MSTPAAQPILTTLTGSCHCRATRYVLRLALPLTAHAVTPTQRSSPADKPCVYRCNCTVCHKAGLLNVRPASPPDDFALLAPRDLGALGAYRPRGPGEGSTAFFFCRTCGVRCFSFKGQGEVVAVDRAEVGVEGDGTVEVWRPEKSTWTTEGMGKCYLSVNGQSIDWGQEGADLRVWSEEGKILYLDCLEAGPDGRERPRYERPHEGGCY